MGWRGTFRITPAGPWRVRGTPRLAASVSGMKSREEPASGTAGLSALWPTRSGPLGPLLRNCEPLKSRRAPLTPPPPVPDSLELRGLVRSPLASRLESGFLHSPSHSCAPCQGAGLCGKPLGFRVGPDAEKPGYLLPPSRRCRPEARLPAPRGLQSAWAAPACFPGPHQAASPPPRETLN